MEPVNRDACVRLPYVLNAHSDIHFGITVVVFLALVVRTETHALCDALSETDSVDAPQVSETL
jgi:hypothetical protein